MKLLKNLTVCSLAIYSAGVAQHALAHTGVKDQAEEGKVLYSAFTLSHGCATNEIAEGSTTELGIDGNTKQKGVIAQSVLFPNADDAVFGKIDAAGYLDSSADTLDKHIQGVTGNILPISPVVTFPQPFDNTYVVRASANDEHVPGGTTRGFQGWNDKEQIPMGGGTLPLSGFRVAALKFQPTSCAKSLKVQIAIANYCHAGGKSKDSESDRADIWIGAMTGKFNDLKLMPNAAGTKVSTTDTRDKIYWPTLTINRILTTNPLPEGCNGGFDIGIQPSARDIDANLPLALPRSGHKDLPGKNFWPTKQ